jgi:hypothetical protein
VFGEIDRYAPRLVFSQPLVDRSPGWLVVEIEKPECLAVSVRDAEGLGKFLDGPRRREAATATVLFERF